MKGFSKLRRPQIGPEIPIYRRPSRRGANGGKREIMVTSLSRASGYHRSREQRVPYIRMSGLWLQRLGFSHGHRIEITEERHRLVLTVIPDEPELPIN